MHSQLTLNTTKQSCSRGRMGLPSLPSKAFGQGLFPHTGDVGLATRSKEQAPLQPCSAGSWQTQLSLLTRLEKSSTSQTSFLLTKWQLKNFWGKPKSHCLLFASPHYSSMVQCSHSACERHTLPQAAKLTRNTKNGVPPRSGQERPWALN